MSDQTDVQTPGDFSEEVKKLEALFRDRFSESDETYVSLKSHPLSNPPTFYPWKVKMKRLRRAWDWDRGQPRWDKERDHRRHPSDRRHQRHDSNYGHHRNPDYRDREDRHSRR